MIEALKSFLRFVGIDRAVFYSNANQMLRLATGPITMVLVLRYLTPEVQGYFYAFSGIVAMQVFLEMGFSQNILQFTAHEFSKLRFTPQLTFEGDFEALSRLISLGRLAFKYYFVAALIAMVAIGIGGHVFFTYSPSHGVAWQGAWWIIAITASFSLAINPLWSLLEGCNRVAEVAQYRFWATIAGFVVSSAALIAGTGIYATAIGALFSLLFSLGYMVFFCRSFLGQFFTPPQHGKVSWQHEIWPFQWRIAVSWISGYFIFSIVNPVAFYFCGPVEAGRFGMSFQLVRMINNIASSWINTKTPRFGILIASRKWKELDALWKKSALQASLMCLFAMLGLLGGMFVAIHFLPKVANRLAPLGTTAWLAAGMLFQLFSVAMANELRAHKKEPFMVISVVNALVTVLLVLPLTHYFGTLGASIGFAIGIWVTFVPAAKIFRHKRVEYRKARDLLAEQAPKTSKFIN